MVWRIWCRLLQGPDAPRDTFVKHEGVELRFATYEAAEAACVQLRQAPGLGLWVAYVPVPVPEERA